MEFPNKLHKNIENEREHEKSAFLFRKKLVY